MKPLILKPWTEYLLAYVKLGPGDVSMNLTD